MPHRPIRWRWLPQPLAKLPSSGYSAKQCFGALWHYIYKRLRSTLTYLLTYIMLIWVWVLTTVHMVQYRVAHCHCRVTQRYFWSFDHAFWWTSCPTMKFCTVPACSTSHTSSIWSCRQTSKWCTGKLDPPNLHQDEGRWAAFTGVETNLRPTIYHLGPPDLSWHGCNSDWGPAASGGQTILANDRNGGKLRLIALCHDDDAIDTWNTRRWWVGAPGFP